MALEKPTLFIFDFDCTITSRHFFGLMMNDDKVNPVDLDDVKMLRPFIVDNFGRLNASIKEISKEYQNKLINYLFGSKERLDWLHQFFQELSKLPNVQIEIWTRSYCSQVENILTKDYIDLQKYFNKIVDRKSFKSKKMFYLDTLLQNYSKLFIFDDSSEEFSYLYTKGDIFDTYKNVYMYNKLVKESSGLEMDNTILEKLR